MLLGVHEELWRRKHTVRLNDPGCLALDPLSFTLFVR